MQIKLPIIGKINIGRVRNSVEDDPSWERFKELLYGYSGGLERVTLDTALQVATVIRCVDVVAKNMATLPLHLYRVTAAGAEKAREQQLYEILHSLPNAETTAYDFWMMYIYNLMLTPAAYAYIDRNPGGFIIGLRNLPSRYCRMKRNEQTGERYVEYYNGKIRINIYPENLMYTPGARLSDVDNPLDPIMLAGKVLKLTASLNTFADKYFANGANTGGVVSLQAPVKEEIFKEIQKNLLEAYAGVMNANKLMVLNGTMKYEKTVNDPDKSQALESRQNQVYEICRMMGVTPFKVFEYGRATYNNMEQVNIEFVQETVSPMAVRLEQTINRDLLLPYQRPTFYAKFNLYGLLRGDTAAQTSYWNVMRQNGILNANEIREKMDENSISPEEGGDTYFVNGNLISMKTAMNSQAGKANITVN